MSIYFVRTRARCQIIFHYRSLITKTIYLLYSVNLYWLFHRAPETFVVVTRETRICIFRIDRSYATHSMNIYVTIAIARDTEIHNTDVYAII